MLPSYFRHWKLSRKIQCAKDLDLLGLNCLGEIPQLKIQHQLDLTSDLHFPGEKYFKAIAENFLNQVRENHLVLLITSPSPSSGKSFTAAHMALALSQHNKSVLLLDLDLRFPSLKNYLNLPSDSKGLEWLLDDDFDKQSCCFSYGPHLDVICFNKIKFSPTEFLESQRLRAFINQQKNFYDFVIMDSAPLKEVIDPFLLIEQSNALLLVLQPGTMDPHEMARCYQSVVFSKEQRVFTIINGI